MRTSFAEAFLVVDDALTETPTLSLVSEQPGSVVVKLRTTWRRSVETLQFELQVPLVEPVRFSWDKGVYGAKIMFPRCAERFCFPQLSSRVAERLASSRPSERREMFAATEDWEFCWESFYDRLNKALIQCVSEKLEQTERQLTIPYVRSQLQRAVKQVVNGSRDTTRRVPGDSRQENGRSKPASLPLTDEAVLVRHMFEVELNFPDVPLDDWLYEQMKLAFLRFVDPGADLTFTSKSKTGRFVMRTNASDPVSQTTGQPMPKLALMFNPLHGVSDPRRTARENRSACLALRLVSPAAPPLQSTAIAAVPPPYQERITTLNIAFADIEGLNAWTADEEAADLFPNTEAGEKLGLDGIMLCPSGQEKLRAYATKSEIIEEDEYLAIREELAKEPGFREQEMLNLVETLVDGTPVFTRTWRYWYDEPLDARYGKYKLTVGGVKGVGRPIEQLWTVRQSRRRQAEPATRRGRRGKLEKVDAVVSIRTVLSKGAADAVLYALAAVVGLTAIDPAWTREEIGQRISEGLEKQGLAADGCSDVIRLGSVSMYGLATLQEEEADIFRAMGVQLLERPKHVKVGRAIVGPCPAVVAPESEKRQASASQGVALTVHSRLLQLIPFKENPRAEREIAQLGEFWQAAGAIAAGAVEEINDGVLATH